MQAYTWFYTLAHPLDEQREQQLRADFDAFLQRWKSHGTPVSGLIRIVHRRFIIIQADPSVPRPSGCSIDSLRRAVGEILQRNGCEVLDSAYVCYRDAEGAIQAVHFSRIQELVAQGVLTADTIVFDNSLGQSDDLNRWEVPLVQTWLQRYLPKVH